MQILNKIYNIDCREGLREIKDNSIDLIITSPPYKDSDNFSYGLIDDVFMQLFRVLKQNSLYFLNFGHLAEDKFRPFSVCASAINAGFKLNDTIVWSKNHYRPIQGSKRLNNLTEFIFLLYKGEMPNIDRFSIGIPYQDKSNAKRFSNGRDLKCRGNLWHIHYETIQKSSEKTHNDRFPIDLPKMCIKLSGIPDGAVVIDPFMGSGTTALAALELKKQFVGFEKNIDHIETFYKKQTNYIDDKK